MQKSPDSVCEIVLKSIKGLYNPCRVPLDTVLDKGYMRGEVNNMFKVGQHVVVINNGRDFDGRNYISSKHNDYDYYAGLVGVIKDINSDGQLSVNFTESGITKFWCSPGNFQYIEMEIIHLAKASSFLFKVIDTMILVNNNKTVAMETFRFLKSLNQSTPHDKFIEFLKRHGIENAPDCKLVI